MKKEKFVMLGERGTKGRILKNEKYTVDEFLDNVFGEVEEISKPQYTILDKLLKTDRWYAYLDWTDNEELLYFRYIAGNTIHRMIDGDE